MKGLLFLALSSLVPLQGTGRQHVWMIGGGPHPHSSEAQIEFNVNWVVGILDEITPRADVRVYFANGTAEGNAVVEWNDDAEADSKTPLARVFRDEGFRGGAFRPHRVRSVAGSTREDLLVPELERHVRELGPGDQLLIVYNGHGSWERDHAENGLRLWGETNLSVREFEEILAMADTAATIRFVFTQCYSGAFDRAAYAGANPDRGLASGERCGFFAESEDRLSEGCSATINIGDYRDYTTYFFAALAGRTRTGEVITADPDVNLDGSVSPFEAHLYALQHAENADLPRATSEVFLERWRPWYVRWLTSGPLPDNEYGRIARNIARAHGLPEDGASLRRASDSLYRVAASGFLEGQRRAEALLASIEQRKDELASAVGERWPVLLEPYSGGYAAFLQQKRDSVEAFLVAQASFGELAAMQDSLPQLEREQIGVERRLTQMEKLRRTRMLARTLHQFERFASAEDRAAYGRLRTCEQRSLVETP